jgi:hypothetical protein
MQESVLQHFVKKGYFFVFFVVDLFGVPLFFLVFTVEFVIIQQAKPFGIVSIIRSHQLVNTSGACTDTSNASMSLVVTLAHLLHDFFVS